jgi:hypothetical protein
VAVGAWVLLSGVPDRREFFVAAQDAQRSASGAPQLVGIERLPEMDSEMCLMPASTSMFQSGAAATAANRPAETVDRKPLRIIRDTYPTYSAIAQDAQSGDIFLQDENLFGIRVFDRLDNTPANAAFTEPKRMLQGEKTKLEFNCGLYIDPVTGDVYSVSNDTTNILTIFDRNAEGNVPPKRELTTPQGTYGIAVDEKREELYLTVQHVNTIVVYRKHASGTEQPLRRIVGQKTQLEDPHGISLDTRRGLILVTNHGNAREGTEPKWGKFEPPSITIHAIDANGDAAPVRVIEGDKTRLNWPAHIWVDEERGEYYVANDPDHSILVFNIEDTGNVAPRRVIRGERTQIRNPMGVYLDAKNNELWVSNMGNHRATVFDRTANGNVAPKRVIRSAPSDKLALTIGNPGAVGYDSKREEILVPN